jgi:transposase-like protein
MAETYEQGHRAFDGLPEKCGAQYEAASACLEKQRDVLLSFYDFPAEHWKTCG